MSLFRFPMRMKVAVEALSYKFVTSSRMFFTPGLEFCPVGSPMQSPEDSVSNSLSDLIEGIWLMAAPKSKVTNMKKKRKHISYIPKAKGWSICHKCGEAKLPHRICNKHLEICAMGVEEWQEKKLSIKKEGSSSE